MVFSSSHSRRSSTNTSVAGFSRSSTEMRPTDSSILPPLTTAIWYPQVVEVYMCSKLALIECHDVQYLSHWLREHFEEANLDHSLSSAPTSGVGVAVFNDNFTWGGFRGVRFIPLKVRCDILLKYLLTGEFEKPRNTKTGK